MFKNFDSDTAKSLQSKKELLTFSSLNRWFVFVRTMSHSVLNTNRNEIEPTETTELDTQNSESNGESNKNQLITESLKPYYKCNMGYLTSIANQLNISIKKKWRPYSGTRSI